jgi:hypothetical protein
MSFNQELCLAAEADAAGNSANMCATQLAKLPHATHTVEAKLVSDAARQQLLRAHWPTVYLCTLFAASSLSHLQLHRCHHCQ